jgi:hypothetical protein
MKYVWLAAQAARNLHAAGTVHDRSEKGIITDGPFAETKEILAGSVADADDQDGAAWGRKLPLPRWSATRWSRSQAWYGCVTHAEPRPTMPVPSRQAR